MSDFNHLFLISYLFYPIIYIDQIDHHPFSNRYQILKLYFDTQNTRFFYIRDVQIKELKNQTSLQLKTIELSNIPGL